MIRTLHRTRGASAIGASRPGGVGPYGRWPVEPDPDDDDGQDDEDPSSSGGAGSDH